MAVRFDADESYTSTSSPPSGTAYTVLCWAKLSADRNTWSAVWDSDSSSTNYLYMATDSDGTTMKGWVFVSGNERTVTGPNMTVGTWYRLALVVNGTNATLYHGTASGALSAPSVANWLTITGTTTFRVGADVFSGEWLNGCVANLKHYSTDLTQAEVERELGQYMPDRTSNLVRWHPFIANETTDYSGNARTLSGGATTAREDGPPIPWRTSRLRTVIPASSENAPITLGQAVETSTAGAFTRSKTARVGQATEADTASALSRTKARLIGWATETNSAHGLSRAKNRAIGQAQEADTAQPLTVAGANVIVLGQAVETNTATALARTKRLRLAQAAESNSALVFTRTKARSIDQASEVDTTTTLSRSKTLILQRAAESDTALPFVFGLPDEVFTVGGIATGWTAGDIDTGWEAGHTRTGWTAGELT